MATNEAEPRTLTYQDALEVLQHLARGFLAATGRPLRSIVAFGGTALAAHDVRARSCDVDVYVSDVDDAVLDATANAFKTRFGPAFKIDATPSNTLWGAIALADIEESPIVGSIDVGGVPLAVRALSIETLYIVKSAADRPKDQPDIRALAKRTTYAATLERAREMFPWYADRNAFPEQVERLVRYLSRDYRISIEQVERDFDLPDVTRRKLKELRDGMRNQFLHMLKGLMNSRPDLIAYQAANPEELTFDAEKAGAGDEILAIMRQDPASVLDMAAVVLKARDPNRHMARMIAIRNAKRGRGR